MIVVADDSPVDCRLVERLLTAAMPVRIFAAENGAEALQMISQHGPDLVLTDLNMPGMSGLELVQTIQRQNPTGNVARHFDAGEVLRSSHHQGRQNA